MTADIRKDDEDEDSTHKKEEPGMSKFMEQWPIVSQGWT